MQSSPLIRALLALAATLTPLAMANPIASVAAAPSGTVDIIPGAYYGSIITAEEAAANLANATSVVALGERAITDSSDEHMSISKRSYVATCRNCNVFSESWLQCECREARQGSTTYFYTNINFNNCITNKNGVLQWQISGNFAPSCGPNWWAVGSLYGTTCNYSGGSNPTTINLDERIHNSNGVLYCSP